MAYEICKALGEGAGCYVKTFFEEWGPVVYIAVALLVALIVARAIRGRAPQDARVRPKSEPTPAPEVIRVVPPPPPKPAPAPPRPLTTMGAVMVGFGLLWGAAGFVLVNEHGEEIGLLLALFGVVSLVWGLFLRKPAVPT